LLGGEDEQRNYSYNCLVEKMNRERKCFSFFSKVVMGGW
jgi:hypothetical protein